MCGDVTPLPVVPRKSEVSALDLCAFYRKSYGRTEGPLTYAYLELFSQHAFWWTTLLYSIYSTLPNSSWKKWSFLPLRQSLDCLENLPFFLEGAACLCSTWVKRRGQGQLPLKFHIDMELSHENGATVAL